MKKINYHTFFSLLLYFLSYCVSAQTTVIKTDSIWKLHVDEKPFDIKGVTFGHQNDVQNYNAYLKDLQSLGVNTIRLWATDENTGKLLDAAHKYNIKIMMGIWMRHGRPGMEDDDSFNYLKDTKGMEIMYANAIEIVQKYKDHPAVLIWGIGNEVYLNMETDAEKEAYSNLLERICSDIKKIDKNHLVSSVEAWNFGLDWWQKYVPSLDIYGLNSYGAGANFLADELKKRSIDKPYMITEFNVTGEWDIKNMKNGIKVEPSDQEKYNAVVTGYRDWIKSKPNCLGVYIFHYSDGTDFMAPWLFSHYNGLYRPTYWAIREAYTGKKPSNYIPEIKTFQISEETLKSDTWIPVILEVSDKENEELNISFHYNQRTGSRKRRDQISKLNYRGSLTEGFEIQVPKEHGAVKVYVNVKDSFTNVGIAATGITVEDETAKNRKYKVVKAQLPFYVYKDGNELPYVPTGYMGNYEAIVVDTKHKKDVYSGTSSIKISYTAESNWYGLAFVDPKNDWGNILGGYEIEGAKKFSFWAKSNKENVVATIGFGLIDTDKPFPDTAKKSKKIKLTTKWKKYTFNVKRLDLSCIRSGLVVFSSGNPYRMPQNIYIDEVVFE